MRELILSLSLLFLLSCGSPPRFQGLKPMEGKIISASLSKQTEREDFTLEGKKAKVDILVFLDVSPSMYHHLEELGRHFFDIFSVLSDYDVQIGLSSADHGDHEDPSGLQKDWRDFIGEKPAGRFGSLMNLEDGNRLLPFKILSLKIPDYKNVFFHTVSHSPEIDCHRPPYCQGPLEQPLRSLKSSMQRALLDNSSFFRPTADFMSLIMTNERERGEDRQRATKPQELIQTFNEIFGHLNKKFIAYNILIMDEECLRREQEQSEVASFSPFIAKLAELTGGSNISICHPHYGEVFKDLSRHLKNSLENSVLLKKEPIPGTVELQFEGDKLNWKRYGRKIIFEGRGSGGSVSVFYKTSP